MPVFQCKQQCLNRVSELVRQCEDLTADIYIIIYIPYIYI